MPQIMDIPVVKAKVPTKTQVMSRRKFGKPEATAKRSQTSDLRARRASAGPRGGAFNPQDSAELFAQEFVENDYTPMDFLKQVGGFPGQVYSDADQMVRGLISLPGALAENTPLDVGKAAVSGAIEQYSDPIGYINEHPGFAMMDVAALLGAPAALGRAGRAGGLLDDAAMTGRLAAEGAIRPPLTTLDPAFPRAIGALGKRLETGELPSTLDFLGQQSGTAAAPAKARATYQNPNLEGHVLAKKAAPGNRMYGQAEGEIVSSELNLRSGERLPMAGVQEHPAVTYRRGESHPGALIEFVEGMEEPTSYRDFLAAATVHGKEGLIPQDFRNLTLFDTVTGNVDRAIGHNLGILEGRALPFDQGLSMNKGAMRGSLRPGDVFAPQPVWRGKEALTPDNLEYVESLREALQNPSQGMMRNAGPEAIREAIGRAEALLGRKNLYGDATPGSLNYFAQKRIGPSPAAPPLPPRPDLRPNNADIRAIEAQAAAEEAMDLARYADEFGGDDVDIAVLDGIREAMGPPVSQFSTPPPPPGAATAEQWMGETIARLDTILDHGERLLLRDIVKGMSKNQEGYARAIDFLRNVWAKRVKGVPFPARPNRGLPSSRQI